MPYVQNILKYLAKHYEDHKESKKKLTNKERTFCLCLIRKIDSFCIANPQLDRQKFDKFKASGLSFAAYIKKYKIKDPAKFKRIVKKFEESCPVLKYDQVKEGVHRKFLDARSKGEAVHQGSLQKWAQEESSSLGLKKKCNSLSFASTFKKKFQVVSRKIQQHRNFGSQTEEELAQVADEFVDEVSEVFRSFDPANVWNSDQVGINYEPIQKRTLETKGTKLVTSHVTSKSKTTHSFTIQPCVSLTGQLNSKLLIILQEPNGSFGPQVGPKVRMVEQECGNVIVRCSKSGNINKDLLEEWVANFKMSNPGSKLLLWDSLSFQKSSKDIFEENGVLRIEVIPENTTKYAQPLDSLINIQIKFLYKHLFWHLQSNEFQIDRYVLIKLCSIVWNQLGSSKFEDLVKAGWSSCLYQSDTLSDNHKNYLKVKDVCFNELSKCEVLQCQLDSVISCSHCEQQLCGFHLVIEKAHLHLPQQPGQTQEPSS